MSLTRDDALAYLQMEFSQQLDDTGMADDDSPEGFESAINAALREVGFTRSQFLTAVVADEDEGAFEAFLEYFALKRFSKYVAQNFDVSTGGDSVRLQQIFANIKSLLADATTAAQVYGLGGSYSSSAYSWQELDLGFLAKNEYECEV
ncbi:MAG: hypothetical protein J0I20_35740 [Chloroflexi bacterium]|nr:hypothetical protein [Chloroflexota bacterium]OJV86957.1 MAG: hypothetical protein BGO39_28555 [Chloroflexi bacterium 54-19]